MSIHSQAKQAFQEGLESILRQWTALELAVLNQWGGPSSNDKANQLCNELLQRFISNTNQLVYRDDLLIYLDDFMELNFCTICEDNSTGELAELLIQMWNECTRGDFTLVTNALAREYMRHEVVKQCQGIDDASDGMLDDNEELNCDQVADDDTLAESTSESMHVASETTGLLINSRDAVSTSGSDTVSGSEPLVSAVPIASTMNQDDEWQPARKVKGSGNNKR